MELKNFQLLFKEISERSKEGKKLKGKYPPISFLVKGVPKTLKIKSIISLGGDLKNIYLFRLKNYLKSPNPKSRYFLTVILAYQSSDLLVSLAKDFISGSKALKLIQYSIYPNTLRVNLLLLIELDNTQSFSNAVEMLEGIRQEFRKKLDKITTLMENE